MDQTCASALNPLVVRYPFSRRPYELRFITSNWIYYAKNTKLFNA
jgi:hypothetical protein